MQISEISDSIKIAEFLGNNLSSPTHWPDWNILVKEHFNTNFYYLGAFNKDKLIGVCPIHKVKSGKHLFQIRSGQFHYIPYGGWIFSEEIPRKTNIFPVAWNCELISHSLPDLVGYHLYKQMGTEGEENTLTIDLNKSISTIWETELNSKRRNMVRKAEKNGLLIRRDVTQDDLDRSYIVYQEVMNRLEFPKLSNSFFYELFFNMENIKLDIFTAYQGNDVLANICIVSDKDLAIYWLGNNKSKTRNLGQGELLQWRAIQHFKLAGCRYYDLCYIDEKKLPQIFKYKSGFSKEKRSIYVTTKKTSAFRLIKRLS